MSSLSAAIVPVTLFQQNCTLLWNTATNRGAVIDPGGDAPRIEAAIAETGITVEKILLTHGHVDHIGAVADLAQTLKVPIEGPHRADAMLIERLPEIARGYSLPPARSFEPDRWLDEGDKVDVGDVVFDVLHCPGHSPGSIVFVQKDERFAIVGDVLFRGSVGRTDLPGGDSQTLIRSITDKLLPLGDDVAFICGHGPMSTIGDERRSNPFLRGLAS